MRKKLDQIVVVDVECTCWPGNPPRGQENEIIEIGLCLLDIASRQRSEKRSILVKPEHSEISEFCTQKTTLTPAMVEKGVPLRDACAILMSEYRTKERVWASWGDFDRHQFERESRSKGVPYPFGSRHINVKTLFALTHRLPEEVGMAEALKIAGLPLEGTHHRGADDAWNIARLLSGLLMGSAD